MTAQKSKPDNRDKCERDPVSGLTAISDNLVHFRNGPVGVNPVDHLAAGSLLPSVVGTRPPHHAVRGNP
jgi:hypothetical protein